MRHLFCVLTIVITFISTAAPAAERVLESGLRHLRVAGEREWSDFPEQAEAASLNLSFSAKRNATEQTLRLRQQDVKQTWKVTLNGKQLGRLPRNENDMVVYWAVPPGTLKDGGNLLIVEQSGKTPDDVRVGEILLDDRPRMTALSEGDVEIQVLDSTAKVNLPCRITVLNANGALQSVSAVSNEHMAVRPGVIYCGDGVARFGLPAGIYTIYAGRGFEYGIDSVRISIKPGETIRRTLSIRREVPTKGYVCCDTHVHTLTHSGHGDASIEERMLTLAGEGIELPIATDHNIHIDYEQIARKLHVRRYFTPVIGNEVTTRIGHFNVFPVQSGAAVPNFRLDNWKEIFESIYATPNVKVAILNHARDIHGGYRPFGPRHHNALVGRNIDGWNLRANAMELINSGAQQTDVMELHLDWMAQLNAGRLLTPVGSSDSHDVARHFVGQGRTYIRSNDSDPGKINVDQAVKNFVEGRVMVSLGLLTEIKVNGKYGHGDLVSQSETADVFVRVLGPSWSTADHIVLYRNGRKVREAKITADDGKRAGVKWSGNWKLTGLKHDVHLVAIATGPAVQELYWPIAKPYQPTSPVWNGGLLGSSGAVWLDADGDGKRTPAAQYAARLYADHSKSLPSLLTSLRPYDEAVAAHVADLLQQEGRSLSKGEVAQALQAAAPATQRGFREYIQAWRETERAKVEGR